MGKKSNVSAPSPSPASPANAAGDASALATPVPSTPSSAAASPVKSLTPSITKSLQFRAQNVPHALAVHFPGDMEYEEKNHRKPDDRGEMVDYRILCFEGYAKDGAIGFAIWNLDIDTFNREIRPHLAGSTRAVDMSTSNTLTKIPDPRYDPHLKLQLGVTKPDKKRGRRFGGSVKRMLHQQLQMSAALRSKFESDPEDWVPVEDDSDSEDPEPTDQFEVV